ncbi:Predicted ATP-dependent carboligase, ATP-grasp superfamily [Proteiniborus ethanoligenes]|uniref:Predicted ATP-dependent carboligase, ATP-grasp superfamily n=1 Tax=Proteiniborus ethanoligenes TaxID=415015 RepID=A0A1H3QAT7_9FIRM|nr:carboxylate--amine ligase [Proteiniborus ethanoligenes]TAH63640.1 MAG: carboxylate--amine ligase [Gottschalkiaceae bacterium]SDZ10370.1 Predicted ATP-dependent carboligase, ATP-grasp superfamily [Proteiniborus ethanoligenes]
MKNKAIVLGTNYYIALSTIRCLGINGVPVVAIDYSNKDTYAAKSKYLSERLISPHYKNDTKGFIQFLIDYAKKQDCPPVLIPCHDLQVEVIDEHLEELKKYFLIPQTEPGLYTKLMDKGSLHKIAKEMGVAVPETVRVDEENFLEKVENILKYPCIVKPVDSPSFVAQFRRKLFKVHNREELEDALSRAKSAGLEVIVQRIIPGFDDHMYTFDAYLNQEGKVTHWSTCQKYRQFPINFGASVYTGHKYVPELYEIGARFFEELKYKGFAEIEFKKDAETGQFYLIEVNARITNFNNLLYKLGLNMPYITYRELTGSPLEPKSFKEDINLVFWYAYEDLLAIRDYIKTGQLTLGEVLKSLLKPKAYAIWDWKDPMPALAFSKIILDKVFRKIFKTKD